MRLFIGIEFPEEIINELMKIQNQISHEAKRGRFVAKENLHLTLQFLGEVSESNEEKIEQVLRKSAQSQCAFSLGLNDVGGFGNGHPFRVIWVGLHGDIQNLNCLQKEISNSLAALGFPKETRPYQPHITLGRDVEFFEDTPFEKYKETIVKVPFSVKQFSLIESKVENGKRNYCSLAQFALAK